MIKKILIATSIIIASLAVFISIQPSEMKVERSIVIDASPSEIFKFLDNPQAMQAWSPWVKFDPEAIVTFDGEKSGVGALSKWEGKKVGSGKSEISEVIADKKVVTKLSFTKPMESSAVSEFNLEAKGEEQTLVTWSLVANKGFVGKTMSLFMGCKKMVSEQYQKGLNDLKSLVESNK